MQIYGEWGGCILSIIRLHPPLYFHAPHQRVEITFFWSSLHFGQVIGHLGSDDLFFGLHFIALHCGGQKLGQPRGDVQFAKSSPHLEKWQKMFNFAESSPQCSTLICTPGIRPNAFQFVGLNLSCNDIAIGAGGLGFAPWAGQIGRSIASDSPPLLYFFELRSYVAWARR